MEFPFVVVRWMAAVYGQRPVRFFMSTTDDPFPDDHSKVIKVISPNAFKNGQLTKEGLVDLLRVVDEHVKDTGFRMCVVLGPASCIYVEADGRRVRSAEPPNGGVLINQVKVEGSGN